MGAAVVRSEHSRLEGAGRVRGASQPGADVSGGPAARSLVSGSRADRSLRAAPAFVPTLFVLDSTGTAPDAGRFSLAALRLDESRLPRRDLVGHGDGRPLESQDHRTDVHAAGVLSAV